MQEGEGPVTHLVTQTDTAAEHVIDPVIQHAERITGLERDLGSLGEKLTTQLFDTEARLNRAISEGVGQEQINGLRDRITSLESSISELATRLTKPPVEAAGEEARTLVNVPGELVGDVESGGENVEHKKEREAPRGHRKRRKARRG